MIQFSAKNLLVTLLVISHISPIYLANKPSKYADKDNPARIEELSDSKTPLKKTRTSRQSDPIEDDAINPIKLLLAPTADSFPSKPPAASPATQTAPESSALAPAVSRPVAASPFSEETGTVCFKEKICSLHTSSSPSIILSKINMVKYSEEHSPRSADRRQKFEDAYTLINEKTEDTSIDTKPYVWTKKHFNGDYKLAFDGACVALAEIPKNDANAALKKVCSLVADDDYFGHASYIVAWNSLKDPSTPSILPDKQTPHSQDIDALDNEIAAFLSAIEPLKK